jgi:hypothetical protein
MDDSTAAARHGASKTSPQVRLRYEVQQHFKRLAALLTDDDAFDRHVAAMTHEDNVRLLAHLVKQVKSRNDHCRAHEARKSQVLGMHPHTYRLHNNPELYAKALQYNREYKQRKRLEKTQQSREPS